MMPGELRAYLDTNTIIDLFEVPGTAMSRALELAAEGKWTLHTSEFTITELLVKPISQGRRDLVATYESFFEEEPWLTVHPVSRRVLLQAADVRARTGARTADAIHVATAEIMSCAMFISFDARIRLRSDMILVGRDDVRKAQ